MRSVLWPICLVPLPNSLLFLEVFPNSDSLTCELVFPKLDCECWFWDTDGSDGNEEGRNSWASWHCCSQAAHQPPAPGRDMVLSTAALEKSQRKSRTIFPSTTLNLEQEEILAQFKIKFYSKVSLIPMQKCVYNIHNSIIYNCQKYGRTQCPSADECVNEKWNAQTKEYHSATGRNEVLTRFSRMNLENTI